MAIIFTEGFDHYNTPSDFTMNGFTQDPLGSVTVDWGWSEGRFGYGRCYFASDSYPAAYYPAQKNLSSNYTTVISGIAIKSASSVPSLVFIENDAGTYRTNVTVKFDADVGQIRVTDGAGTVHSSSMGLFNPNAWNYCEAKVVHNNTTGAVTVRINGVTVYTLTNIDTVAASGHGYSNILRLGAGWNPSNAPGTSWFDDWYACDTTGTGNNDFLGEQSIITLFPTTAGSSTNWTPQTSVTIPTTATVFDTNTFNPSTYSMLLATGYEKHSDDYPNESHLWAKNPMAYKCENDTKMTAVNVTILTANPLIQIVPVLYSMNLSDLQPANLLAYGPTVTGVTVGVNTFAFNTSPAAPTLEAGVEYLVGILVYKNGSSTGLVYETVKGATITDYPNDVTDQWYFNVDSLVPPSVCPPYTGEVSGSYPAPHATFTVELIGNYANCQEADRDTITYNSSSTINNLDLFNIASQTIPSTATVNAVSVMSVMCKDDVGSHTATNQLYSGGAMAVGAAKGITTDWAYLTDVLDKDPFTTSYWTPARVNGMEAGYKLES